MSPTPTPAPTGRVTHDGTTRTIVWVREFRAPVEDVWASITESDRLARWIGTWEGDPASGSVTFSMNAEGDAPAEEMVIRRCEPPYRLHLTSQSPAGTWLLDLDLTEADGTTTLAFTHAGLDPVVAESVGPGWDYYLDRLVAAETGGDVGALDFDRDYYPAMLEHYRGLLGPSAPG